MWQNTVSDKITTVVSRTAALRRQIYDQWLPWLNIAQLLRDAGQVSFRKTKIVECYRFCGTKTRHVGSLFAPLVDKQSVLVRSPFRND